MLTSRSPRAALVAALLLLCLPDPAGGAARTVREPAYGIPHFYADTDLELARENGREIAKDRLGQLILLARAGRGTLFQAFGALDAGFLADDLEARETGYTSSELNGMWAKLPEADRMAILEYCRGVNDTIDRIYAGELPEPIEVTLARNVLGLEDDLFGNATNLSDQVDPFYEAPGGADPEHPNGGFQFTPEMAIAVAVLEIRNFGLESFGEASRLAELQALIAKHGTTAGTQLWEDRNFLVDPLAPVSVPDSIAPGFGGPLARGATAAAKRLAAAAQRYPERPYAEAMQELAERHAARAERAKKLGAWPMLGSYAWAIAPSKSGTGNPWIGGFPQTGTLTPSLMHFAENRSAEGIHAVGMEFVGGPFILIGHTDHVAYTTTTAQLQNVSTFFEEIVNEDSDTLRYSDEGTPAPLSMRTETIRGPLGQSPVTRIFWRSHERGGNGGSRPIVDFTGDAEGTADSGATDRLVDAGAFGAAFAGGHVAIVGGTGAGQIRSVSSVPDADTLVASTAWTTPPDDTSEYVAVESGGAIIAVASDSAVWLEESTAALGFSRYQRADSILDVRAGARLIPSTHNFLAADNRAFNGIGTNHGKGNIGYWSSGFSRVRQDGTDRRLPLDGTVANPLVVASGTVGSATSVTLSAPGTFTGLDLSPPAVNLRYDDPTQTGSEFIVVITSGDGYKQTRRIASNTADELVVESAWGVVPSAGDGFEVIEILGMPEAINPSEGYTGNWNNKAARLDPGEEKGRQHRVIFILERLAASSLWTRGAQRQLNEDLAGLTSLGRVGRFLVPRLSQAVATAGNGGNPDVDTVLAALEDFEGPPLFGRGFIDPVTADTIQGERELLDSLVDQLAADIFGDEYEGAIPVPTGDDALHLVQHAIDSAAGSPAGRYTQSFAGDYFDGVAWETQVRDTLASLASAGIPADAPRPDTTFNHPLAAAFEELEFPPTPSGNRGAYEQIVEVGPQVRGEFIFPLGQSGLIQGSFSEGITSIDPNFTTLHPVWRDWRFVPMLSVSADLAFSTDGDVDGDGVLDGFERWYFGDTRLDAEDDSDGDQATLAEELAAGSSPTAADTDADGVADGEDFAPQDRLVTVPEPAAVLLQLAAGVTLAALARQRRARAARRSG